MQTHAGAGLRIGEEGRACKNSENLEDVTQEVVPRMGLGIEGEYGKLPAKWVVLFPGAAHASRTVHPG